MAIYGFGSNLMSQMGLQDGECDVHTPVELGFFKDKKVIKIACGKLHTLVLCENNELYSCGVNDDYALGYDGSGETFERVPFNRGTIVDISAGASHSAVLTGSGRVYGCGTFKSTSGIIGFSASSRYQMKLARIGRVSEIVKIRSGANHILMIDSRGRLWAVGANESGQQGYYNRPRTMRFSLTPTQISPNNNRFYKTKYKDVCGGGFHSLALSCDYEVVGWGSNFNGQLGNGTLEPSVEKKPVLVEEVEAICSGKNHSFFITKDRKLYGCGENSMHQVGVEGEKVISTPRPILENVSMVAAGCDYSIAVVDNKLYGWGLNSSGETGGKDVQRIPKPRRIDFEFGEVLDVVCGTDFTLVHTK
ncbi:regulator of chromosome condensation [Pancytospora epiphaga]|nr:regulator of chromosome condensation [Pancytospora epiphaga]